MAQETAGKTAPGPDPVQLALERTFLAYERTLMAWIRTATSLITFGFALYKFFFYVHQEKPPTVGEEIFGARTYGLCMMGIGVITLAIATWQHRQQIKALRRQYPGAPPSLSLSLVLAALIASPGVLGFTAAIFRL